jgi:hypothetical protein
LIEFGVQFAAGVSASVAATLLMDWWRSRFRGRVDRTRWEKTEVDFDEQEKIKEDRRREHRKDDWAGLGRVGGLRRQKLRRFLQPSPPADAACNPRE